jgi:outer membrane scaffolding protein for murein synthesis (MipA/OmpV family)
MVFTIARPADSAPAAAMLPALTPAALYGLAAVLIYALLAAPAMAKEEPLLEVGLGIGAIAFEDYRGSSTTHAYPLPIGYLLYNGDFFKADREGVRGLLFNQSWVELNLSGNLTTPVKNDRQRSGMPDLRSTVEAGPSLDFHLLKSADGRVKFDLRMPVRAAFTVQAVPKYIGWTFNPRLALDLKDPAGFAGWNLGLMAGPLFADRKYHNYFYAVAEEYATDSRPAYQASAGYAGFQTLGAVSKRFPKFWVGAYARYDTLDGAVFADSPLVTRNSYWSAGFGISWIIHTSTRMVEVPD